MVGAMGTIGVNAIKGSQFAKTQIMEMWTFAYERASLNDPRVAKTVQMSALSGYFPTLGEQPVQMQLEEFEASQTETAKFGAVELRLKKDRVRLGASDESRMESTFGDPLTVQKSQNGAALANALDTEIAQVLGITPQTVPDADWTTTKPIRTLAAMSQLLLPYTPTAAIFSNDAFAEYLSQLGDQIFVGNTTNNLDRATAYIPGMNIPIIVSNKIATADEPSVIYMVSADVPGVVVGTGQIKIREWDNPDQGAYYYQYDIWRTPFSNLIQKNGFNAGVVKAVITE